MSPKARGRAGRVIAGSARGVVLEAPGAGTRPLGDRVKQTAFGILEPDLRGRRFLDLYAGSGAGGIEALSRGAAEAVFVDRDDVAVRVIERNLRATHLEHAGRTVRAEAVTWLDRHGAATGPYAAILVDPPYDAPGELEAALGLIARPGPGGILEPGGVVVAKHFWRTPPPARIGLLRSSRERRFGETTLSFLRWADEEDR